MTCPSPSRRGGNMQLLLSGVGPTSSASWCFPGSICAQCGTSGRLRPEYFFGPKHVRRRIRRPEDDGRASAECPADRLPTSQRGLGTAAQYYSSLAGRTINPSSNSLACTGAIVSCLQCTRHRVLFISHIVIWRVPRTLYPTFLRCYIASYILGFSSYSRTGVTIGVPHQRRPSSYREGGAMHCMSLAWQTTNQQLLYIA